jgi:hypothetical protein
LTLPFSVLWLRSARSKLRYCSMVWNQVDMATLLAVGVGPKLALMKGSYGFELYSLPPRRAYS